MSNLVNLILWEQPQNAEEQKYLYMLSVKTQFADLEVHAVVIDFFRYISAKYLKNFTLSDEGQYWESKNKKVLQAQFDRYNSILDTFTLGLESIPPNTGENLESYLVRVAQRTNNHLNKDEP
ncbi:MAG: hypothetical protein JXR50_06415 [Prolixibacteraceae bacterium]|nr:hypothetical protein [Prolixibacteraceae bacterium]MBN2649357.1 hypothetical protein [Prolixibacteraceae bacterium]